MAHGLPKLGKLKLGRDQIDLDYYLTADYANIEDASAELPSVIEWVNSMSQGYVEQMHSLKDEVEQAEAIAYFELLSPGEDTSFNVLFPHVPKATAEAVGHAVALDMRVRDTKANYAQKRALVERLRRLQNSLMSKLELTRSSEATRRKVFTEETEKEE